MTLEPEANTADALDAVDRQLSRFELPDGDLAIPIALQIFTARRR